MALVLRDNKVIITVTQTGAIVNKKLNPRLKETAMLRINCRQSRFLALLITILLSFLLLSLASAQQHPALKNDDIVKMNAAGLGDAVIIAKIHSSHCEFDTSADALIKLKTSGVSSAVLTAMAEAGNQPVAAQPNTQSSLPTGYGYYLFNGTGFDPLTPSPVKVVAGLQSNALAVTFAVDGFGEDTSPRNLGSPSPVFLGYQQNLDTTALHLYKLDFVTSMQAQEFDIAQIAQSMFDQFQNMYGVARTQPIQVNLWGTRGTEMPLRTEPMPERTGLFRLLPASAMQPGRYALYYRNALHPNLIMNYKGSSDQDAVFYFSVNPTTTPSVATSSGPGATAEANTAAAQPNVPPPVPGQLSISVRHRHSAFFNLSTSDVAYYCYGTLSVSPDGTVAYDCDRTDDPSGRCEHLSFASGSLKQAKVGFAGTLHIEGKKQGKFDFEGNRADLTKALAAIAPQVQK